MVAAQSAPALVVAVVFLTLMLASLLAGCGSASTTLLSPSPLVARCGVELAVSNNSFAAAGGTGTLTVQTARECAWSIAERPAWIAVAPVQDAQGALEVSFAVEPNRSTAGRSGDVVIGDQRTRISQEAATCPWTITPSRATVGASGGDVRASLTTEDFCSWEAVASSGWIAVSPRRGQGSAAITLEVGANTGDKRNGKLQVGGAAVEVEQRAAPAVPVGPPVPPSPPETPVPPQEPEPNSAPPIANPPQAPAPPVSVPPLPPGAACTYVVTPQRFEVSRKSGKVDVSVVTQPGCELQAATTATWLEISPDRRIGSGKLRLEIDENDGAPRTGEVTLTGSGFEMTVIVLQEGKRDDGNN